jgi:glycosyltransferase involved in cell wall biosynthesis
MFRPVTWKRQGPGALLRDLDRGQTQSSLPLRQSGCPMNILIINYEFPPIGGGAGQACYNIARELARGGGRVSVLTARYGNQPERETLDGISVYRAASWRKGIHDCGLRGASTFLWFGFLQLRKLLARDRYDIVHYFFGLPTGILSFYSHGVRRLPYVVSLRGSDVPGYDESSRKLKFLHALLHGLNKRVWRQASSVVAVSQELRRLALQCSPSTPMQVIYNGVDPLRFSPPSYRRNAGPLKLVCVSRLIDRKGLDYLLAALAGLRDQSIQLVIIGTGAKEPQLRAAAVRLNLTARVKFLGYRPNDELCRHLREADVFVLPTLSEAFANVVLEAMACGLPVIASAVGGIPELVEEGVNGLLVPPGDTDRLASAIARMARDPALRRQLSRNNVERVRQKFTWAHAAGQYQSIYAHALG